MPSNRTRSTSRTRTRARSREDDEPASVLDAIRIDPTYRKFRSAVDTIKERVTPTAAVAEARSLHAKRSIRNLKGKTPSAHAVYAAATEDASNRARLIELRTNLMIEVELLDMLIDSTAAYLIASHDLSGYATTKGERSDVINRILKRGVELRAELKSAMNVLDLIVKDIDQAGYAVHNLVEIIKIITDRPGQGI